MPNAPRDRRGFQVAIICALALEAENVQSVFDLFWEDHGKRYGKAVGDQNSYTMGVIGRYNVVLVHMAGMGGNSASLAAAGLRSSFPDIKLVLVVGVCGVVPLDHATNRPIFLGDVVISTAVIQYDFGRQYPEGFQRKSEVEDRLGRANPEIRSFLSRLQTRQRTQRFNESLKQLLSSDNFPSVAYPGTGHDRLYEPHYIHQHRSGKKCVECLVDTGTCKRDCDDLGCEDSRVIPRDPNAFATESPDPSNNRTPAFHLGRFGSANAVMKSGLDRDRIAAADNLIAFEMEGAGVWEQYPTVVIKAACDYADSHKNKRWQNYAAATAAACLKIFLEEWVMSEQQADQDYSSEPIWLAPFDPMPGFVGRENELKTLEGKLLDPSGRRMVSLLGLGGVGKSRLAFECACSIKSKYPQYSVFWVQASGRSTFGKDMLEIAESLQIQRINKEGTDTTTLVKQRLNSMRDWLLILDNADDETLWGMRSDPSQQRQSLVGYLPRTTNGSILVTTRTNRVASVLTQEEVIPLDAMSQQEAANLFISKTRTPDIVVDRDIVLKLMEKLAYLPLAIVQAASYVNMTQQPIQTYLNLVDNSERCTIKLLSKDFGDPMRYPNAVNPVASTWLISFQHIEENHRIAADFLSCMACVHEKGIPRSLLMTTNDQVIDEIDLVDAVAVLTGYSFVTRHTDGCSSADSEETYNMHRLVRLAARNWLEMGGKLSFWTNRCITRLAHLFPSASYKNRGSWTMLIPHAQHICEGEASSTIPEQFDLLEKMGFCLDFDGKYDDAAEALRVVVDRREKTLGVSHLRTLEAYSNYGRALHKQGRTSEAEVYLRGAVDGRLSKLGPRNRETLVSMSSLADVLQRRGRISEAERIRREVLSSAQSTLGEKHPSTLTYLGNLASTLVDQGIYIEGERMHREVLQQRELIFGMSHPNTIASMVSLAVTLRQQKRYAEAHEMFLEVVKHRGMMLGKIHPDTLKGMSHLARTKELQQDYVGAEAIYREVLRQRQAVLGGDHPSTLNSMAGLAATKRLQKDYVEAEKTEREVLRLSRKILGDRHISTLISMNNLALTLKKQDHNEEAISLMRSCLKLYLQTLGASHPDTQVSLANWRSWTGTEYMVSQQE